MPLAKRWSHQAGERQSDVPYWDAEKSRGAVYVEKLARRRTACFGLLRHDLTRPAGTTGVAKELHAAVVEWDVGVRARYEGGGDALIGKIFVAPQRADVHRTSVSTVCPSRRATSPSGAPLASQVVAAAWRQS